MKLNSVISRLILSCFLLVSEGLFASDINLNDNNTNILTAQISSRLVQNPAGEHTPFYVSRLMELAPAIGRDKILKVFEEAVSKIKKVSEKEKLYSQILQYSIDVLDVSPMESEKNFAILKKWNISGPWKRYGRADIEYKFNPETVYKIEEIEESFNQSVDRNGKLFPFRAGHSGDETYYATCSFPDTGAGIVLWVDSDAEYKLRVNGKELVSTRGNSGQVIKAFSLTGAGGYTVQIKMQSGERGSYPYIRGMVSDEKHKPFRLTYGSTIYNYNFKSEKLYSSDEPTKYSSKEAPVITRDFEKLIHSGNYREGYKIGSALIEKYPIYFPAYMEFVPLLDKMNRETEFNDAINKFIKNFPHSDIHFRWLADFYMTRDKEKFTKIMKTAPLISFSRKSLETYLHLLCVDKLFKEALDLCYSMESDPYFRSLIPEIIRASGNDSDWKKLLIDRVALYDDAALYYSLGLAELQRGFDPVMYWEKNFSMDGNPGLMKDLSDVYENSIIAPNDIYNGVYTDLHPEFGWNGKKRKISIHVFESGRVLLEGEDTVPAGRKLRGEKVSEGGSEFVSGELRTGLPYVDNLKILYVLTAKDGLPTAIDFESGPVRNNRVALKYKCSGEEEYSIIKYSAELPRDQSDPFKMINKLVLKSANENISWLEYEVILHGSIVPFVSYNGKLLSQGKSEDGRVRYSVIERLPKNNDKTSVTEIYRFSTDAVFAEWYRDLLNYTGGSFSDSRIKFTDKESFEDIISKVRLHILLTVLKTDGINFNPREIKYVSDIGSGTVEERTHLAKAILQSKGIKSYIAFRKNSAGLIDKILLYVPENMGRDYWLNFYGDDISDKMEPGSVAIVITEDGYNTIPVNPETCIR